MKKLKLGELQVRSFVTKVHQDQIRGGDLIIGDSNELYVQSIIDLTKPTSGEIGTGTLACC